jgi:broad specificity phosphatase PhoE
MVLEAVYRSRMKNIADEWPTRLWPLRHGESAGNIARDTAYASQQPRIEIQGRDIDVPLSPRGRDRSDAVGEWFGRQGKQERPNVI